MTRAATPSRAGRPALPAGGIAAALALAALCASAPSTAAAQTPRDLAKQKNCLTCHGANRSVLGPGFREIATRYAGKPEAEPALVNILLHGGVGNWGKVPMPANTQLSEADARTLVKWILEGVSP